MDTSPNFTDTDLPPLKMSAEVKAMAKKAKEANAIRKAELLAKYQSSTDPEQYNDISFDPIDQTQEATQNSNDTNISQASVPPNHYKQTTTVT
jgi:hypothetical protein